MRPHKHQLSKLRFCQQLLLRIRKRCFYNFNPPQIGVVVYSFLSCWFIPCLKQVFWETELFHHVNGKKVDIRKIISTNPCQIQSKTMKLQNQSNWQASKFSLAYMMLYYINISIVSVENLVKIRLYNLVTLFTIQNTNMQHGIQTCTIIYLIYTAKGHIIFNCRHELDKSKGIHMQQKIRLYYFTLSNSL